MEDNDLIQKEFKALLPIIESYFPEGRCEYSKVNKLMESFQRISFYENDIMILMDHKRHQPIYVSDNLEEITGISKSVLFKWKSMFILKLLDYSHFSYAYRALILGMDFFNKMPKEEKLVCKHFACGMKLRDGKGNLQRIFAKSKVLLVDEKGKLDISIFFIKNVSHLIKGNGYWLRYTSPSKTSSFVKQKGKQHFDDLLTAREIEIVELLAQHKTSSEIADELFISTSTVEKHRKNMIKRAGAVNTTALVHLCKLAEIIK